MNKLITGVIFALCVTIPCSSFAEYALESATLGPVGVGGAALRGYTVDSVQYVGARFHLAAPFQVDHIGGVLADPTFNDNRQIFGAIVGIGAGGDGFPPASMSAFVPLAETTFVVPFFSADLSVPLAVTLPAGDYSLIFGSGRFGATGNAALTTTNPETAQASYFFGDHTFIGDPGTWSDDAIAHNMRFTVTGSSVVPEPSSLILAAMGAISLAAWGWRRRISRRLK